MGEQPTRRCVSYDCREVNHFVDFDDFYLAWLNVHSEWQAMAWI